MKRQSLGFYVFTLLVGVAALLFSGAASADPSARVARLGYTLGAVSFSPAGESDWVQVSVNRALTNGDRLWTDARARAEVDLGGSMIRLNANTAVSLLGLDDRIAQLQLTQGTLNVRVRRLGRDQLIEVDTPNLVLTLRQAGDYRIAVDPDGQATDVIVRAGQAEVLGQGAAYTVDARQAYRFNGPDLLTYDTLDAPPLDEFDSWALSRDRVFDNSRSARYVSPEVMGYQDLDANGSWRVDSSYGPVWTPSRVASGWAPYRDGHWAWIDPWGWTWVDDAPWGFAVSHYGRWTHSRGAWAWVPGPMRAPAFYAPALVVFVGGDNFQWQRSGAQGAGVAWFPLAPREVYRPAYPVSRGYFENVNRSNTVINVAVINNTYNTTNLSKVVYVNRNVPGAVIAVPTNTFVQAQPVSRAVVRMPPATLASAPLAVIAHLGPTERSVRGAGGPGGKPPTHVFERPVVARTAPPTAQVGFAAQQPQLRLMPGKPLDDAARKALKPAVAVPTPGVKLLSPVPLTPPKAMPVPVTPARLPGIAQPQPGARQDTPSTPVTRPPESRGQIPALGNDQRRAQPSAAPSPAPGRPAPEAKPVAPKVVPLVPAAPPPTQRLMPLQQSAPQVVAPALVAPTRPPSAARPQAVPQRGTVPMPVARQPVPESRGQTQAQGNDQGRAQPGAAPSPAPRQRAPESKPVAPPIAPLAPAPPRAAPATPATPATPAQVPAPRVAPPVPPAVPAMQVAPARAAKPVAPSVPVAAPKPQSPPHQAQVDAAAQPGGPKLPPGASRPRDRANDGEPPERKAGDRQQSR